MKNVRIIASLLVLFAVFSACSIEKRVHRPGYFIKFHQAKNHAADRSSEKRTLDLVETIESENGFEEPENSLSADLGNDFSGEMDQKPTLQQKTSSSFVREIKTESQQLGEQLKEEKSVSFKSIYKKAKNSASTISAKRYNPKLFLLIPLCLLFLGLLAITFGFAIFIFFLTIEGGSFYSFELLIPSFIYWGIGLILLLGALISNIIIHKRILKPRVKNS